MIKINTVPPKFINPFTIISVTAGLETDPYPGVVITTTDGYEHTEHTKSFAESEARAIEIASEAMSLLCGRYELIVEDGEPDTDH